MSNFPELVPLLSDLRKKNGLTREMLAEKTGIPKVYIVKYENGTLCPYDDKAKTLASTLGVSVDDMLGKYNCPNWSEALKGAEEMDNLFGTKSLKEYVATMRDIINSFD